MIPRAVSIGMLGMIQPVRLFSDYFKCPAARPSTGGTDQRDHFIKLDHLETRPHRSKQNCPGGKPPGQSSYTVGITVESGLLNHQILGLNVTKDNRSSIYPSVVAANVKVQHDPANPYFKRVFAVGVRLSLQHRGWVSFR